MSIIKSEISTERILSDSLKLNSKWKKAHDAALKAFNKMIELASIDSMPSEWKLESSTINSGPQIDEEINGQIALTEAFDEQSVVLIVKINRSVKKLEILFDEHGEIIHAAY